MLILAAAVGLAMIAIGAQGATLKPYSEYITNPEGVLGVSGKLPTAIDIVETHSGYPNCDFKIGQLSRWIDSIKNHFSYVIFSVEGMPYRTYLAFPDCIQATPPQYPKLED